MIGHLHQLIGTDGMLGVWADGALTRLLPPSRVIEKYSSANYATIFDPVCQIQRQHHQSLTTLPFKWSAYDASLKYRLSGHGIYLDALRRSAVRSPVSQCVADRPTGMSFAY